MVFFYVDEVWVVVFCVGLFGVLGDVLLGGGVVDYGFVVVFVDDVFVYDVDVFE